MTFCILMLLGFLFWGFVGIVSWLKLNACVLNSNAQAYVHARCWQCQLHLFPTLRIFWLLEKTALSKNHIRTFFDSIIYSWARKSITEMTLFCMRNLFARTRLLLVFFVNLTLISDFNKLEWFFARLSCTQIHNSTICLWVFLIPDW